MSAQSNVVSYNAKQPDWDAVDADNNPYSELDLNRLRDMNKRYTHVVASGKNRIVSEKPCPINGKTFVFEQPEEFRQQFTNKPKIGNKRPGAAWFDWPGKNFKQGGIGVYPNPSDCPDSVFNLYPGLLIAPKQGDCSLFLEHLRLVLCGGDEKVYRYLVEWLAHIIQRPEEKPSVAVVLKSVEGTGKGTLFKPLKAILGAMAIQVNGAEQITGKFNALVANKLLVFGDEVDLTDKRAANRLKGLISETSVTVEFKGIDAQQVPNYARFIFAGNCEHIILAGVRERRYLLLEPTSDKAQDKAYFDALHEWADNGGAAALLWYLQQLDISGFDPRRAPVTKALIEEKLANLSLANTYVLEQLTQIRPFTDAPRIETEQLISDFIEWAHNCGEIITRRQASAMLGKTLANIGAKRIGRLDRGPGKLFYEFPPLVDMRIKYAAMLGQSSAEIFT
jgi:putative DNA primase/helicase